MIQEVSDDVCSGDGTVGEGLFATEVRIGKFTVIDTQLMEERCVQVGNRHSLVDRAIAELIGGAVNESRLEAASGDEDRESVSIVIASF